MSIWKRYWGNKKQIEANISVESQQSRGQIWRNFKKHRLAVISLYFMGLVTLLALLAPILAPYEPQVMTNAFGASPSWQHWLGTDQIGRDQLSRIIYGARVSLTVGLLSVVIASVIGTVLGLVSGYLGGWVDQVIMRITDVFMSFPYIMLILVVAAIVGPGLTNIIVILGVLGWPAIARLVRGNVLSLKQTEYVKAAKALGYSNARVMFKHMLPNTVAPILIYATSGVAAAILDEAALSFLGLGVQPPAASWGNMLSSAKSLSVLTTQPWLWLPPGIMILLTVLSINYIGDALRDAYDPRNNK